MTNNPTIDGVSRELLERAILAIRNTSQMHQTLEDLRALLDAPVVERQPLKNASEVAYNLQAENAALQSTIAELQAQKELMLRGAEVYRERIAELESGRGEPVAYVLTRDGEVCYEADDGIVISNTPGDENNLYKWKPVYFNATPAPVAPDKYDDVLLPFLSMMRNELHANAGKGDRPGWLSMTPGECLLEIYYHLGKLQKGVKDGNELWITEYSADVANMAMMLADICGCLDATAALNGVKS